MTTWDDRGLVEDILARSVDDWLHPALVVDIAKRTGVDNAESLRATAIGLITEVILEGWVVAGEVGEDGFSPWDCSPESAITRIVHDWHSWGLEELSPGAIAWLAATPEGEGIGREVLRR